MNRPIFLLGSHKSGTSLLRNLLDGARELFVLPLEAHFFQYSGYWVDYSLRRSLPRHMSFEDLVKSFTNLVELSNERTSQTSESNLVGCWDVGRFTDHLRTTGAKRFEERGFRGFLDSYVEALHASLYDEVPRVSRFAEKSVENAEYASLLKRLYPQAKFVHIIRNPYATIVSIRKHLTRKHYPFLAGAINSLKNSYYYLYKNLSLLTPDYMSVCYEELVRKPEEVMREVAEFIEIEFTQALLEPTTMGEPWRGNSSSGRQFDGISTRPLSRWQEEIQPLETHLVNLMFAHVLHDYGYEHQKADGSPYWPCPRERLKTYLANRYLWRFAVRTRHYTFV